MNSVPRLPVCKLLNDWREGGDSEACTKGASLCSSRFDRCLYSSSSSKTGTSSTFLQYPLDWYFFLSVMTIVGVVYGMSIETSLYREVTHLIIEAFSSVRNVNMSLIDPGLSQLSDLIQLRFENIHCANFPRAHEYCSVGCWILMSVQTSIGDCHMKDGRPGLLILHYDKQIWLTCKTMNKTTWPLKFQSQGKICLPPTLPNPEISRNLNIHEWYFQRSPPSLLLISRRCATKWCRTPTRIPSPSLSFSSLRVQIWPTPPRAILSVSIATIHSNRKWESDKGKVLTW